MLLFSALMANETSSAFESAFQKIGELCATFAAGESHYLSPDYKEAEVRKDFIDKFLIALGWDVNHDTQKNPYEQEVKVEQNVAAGGQRVADYAFGLAPNFKDVRFFVEAKKPFGDIATTDNYFQVNRYGWSKSAPLCVLTDFEQFHVVDCRCKPDIDHSVNRHVLKLHCRDYTDREKFAQIYWLFSREAVIAGSLEKRAKELPKPRGKAVQRGLFAGGYQSVDEAFLEQLFDYRVTLAKAFKKHNQQLDSEALTEITQRVLDRIVFMRFLEDKGIEDRFVEKFGDKGTAWEDFLAASRRLDGIYNGIIFKPHPVFDKKGFAVDEDAFADVCEDISHVNSPYDFNAIPIHILGSIYEQFLGRAIVATDKRVRVEDKPEVRKAGGVYYTPEYIVTYIVQNTVGKLIEGKSPAQISEMRFADIACGSGSFLIGVYELLLHYHGTWYNNHPDRAKKDGCVQRNDGAWHLSLAQRRQILVNNIYGVDIDHQACEVAQLSLYLKLLEEETTGSARNYQLEFKETLLPNLNRNIVCGNSLIGRDILNEQLFASDEERKLNPMDFADAFPHVFRPRPGKMIARETVMGDVFSLDSSPPAPATDAKYTMAKKDAAPPKLQSVGFDAIVGNPPYGFHQIHSDLIKPYFKSHYSASEGSYEHYFLFYEASLKLLRSGGLHGYIVPVTWLTIPSAGGLRKFILNQFSIRKLSWLPELVFKNAQVNTLVSIIERSIPSTVEVLISSENNPALGLGERKTLEQSRFIEAGNIIHIFESADETCILSRLESPKLRVREIARPCSGYNPYEVGAGYDLDGKPQTSDTVAKKPYHSENQLAADWKPEVIGRDLGRYYLNWPKTRFIKYGPWLAAPRDQNNFIGPRLLVQEITGGTTHRIIAAYCDKELYHSRDVIPIKCERDWPNPLFLLGILNSWLISWRHHRRSPKAKKALFPKVLVSDLKEIPVPSLSKENKLDCDRHDRMVQLVEQMITAKKQFAAATTEKDKTYYEKKSAALDGDIDRLVYELYGLTPDEIEIVEAATKK